MSKETEAFENILEQTGDNGYSFADRLIVDQALSKAEELEKILNLLVTKNVNIWWFKGCETAEQYNTIRVFEGEKYAELAPEEFVLLKEYKKYLYKSK